MTIISGIIAALLLIYLFYQLLWGDQQ
ncbi:K(+)-transporting ATPase subunit F [Enterococcus sp. DIV0242_7C1]|nr:K(+)-transporting ATPase subunit F [Enterococcus sp. DIV0242_7C1]MCA5013932.1 K(+)-transporting ATPase subunit F [Enterococcus sp. S23]MCA5017294.1 K(+)-transporting ATPase subunit F [Enterococcus sp. S22(2020)]